MEMVIKNEQDVDEKFMNLGMPFRSLWSTYIPAGEITDIRKVYKNEISDSVMEIYLLYGSRKNIT